MSQDDESRLRRGIICASIFHRSRFGTSFAPPSRTTAGKRKYLEYLEKSLDERQRAVRRRIAAKSLSSGHDGQDGSVDGQHARTSLEISDAERAKVVRALESRARPGLSRRATDDQWPPIRDPAFTLLGRSDQLQSYYAGHAARVKKKLLQQCASAPEAHPSPSTPFPAAFSQLAITSPAHPTGGAPNLGPSILSRDLNAPMRSNTMPMTATEKSAIPTPTRPNTSALRQPNTSSQVVDRGGRRQTVEPSLHRARRQSMGDVRATPVERVEGFFPPGQPSTSRPEPVDPPKTAGKSEIDPSRDPRKRR